MITRSPFKMESSIVIQDCTTTFHKDHVHIQLLCWIFFKLTKMNGQNTYVDTNELYIEFWVMGIERIVWCFP